MARKGYKVADLVAVLGCSEKTARNKLNGGTEFTVGEAVKVRDEMFPDARMEYLFGPGAAWAIGDDTDGKVIFEAA